MHTHRLGSLAVLGLFALVIGCGRSPRFGYESPLTDAGTLAPRDDAGDTPIVVPFPLEPAPLEPLPAPAVCATTWLVSGTTSLVDTREGGVRSSSCTSSAGPQLFYRLRIPAQTRATITAQPSTPWLASIGLLDDCSGGACLASGTSSTAGEAASATFANGADVPRDVIVAVGGVGASDAGELELTTALEALRVTTANAECRAATLVDAEPVWLGEDASFATTRSSCGTSGKGAALFYRARVAPGATISIEASPEGEWDPVIALLDSCGASTCRAEGNRSGAGTPERLVHTNRTASDEKLVIAIASADPLATGRFDLRVTWTPPPANTTCDVALYVGPGEYLAHDAAAASDVPATICRASDTGGVLYYRVKVAVGETLVASAAASGEPFDIGLRLLDSCGASQCLASESGGALVYTNHDATDRELWLAVGAASAGDGGPFDLSIELRREPD